MQLNLIFSLRMTNITKCSCFIAYCFNCKNLKLKKNKDDYCFIEKDKHCLDEKIKKWCKEIHIDKKMNSIQKLKNVKFHKTQNICLKNKIIKNL